MPEPQREILDPAADMLAAAFSLEPAETSDLSALQQWLAAEVQRLLDTRPAHLMSLLYRIDVRERDVKAALADVDPASALAEALIARQIEKEETRRRYREEAPEQRRGLKT